MGTAHIGHGVVEHVNYKQKNIDKKECRGTGSNCRHLVFQTSALPLSYLGITYILY